MGRNMRVGLSVASDDVCRYHVGFAQINLSGNIMRNAYATC